MDGSLAPYAVPEGAQGPASAFICNISQGNRGGGGEGGEEEKK